MFMKKTIKSNAIIVKMLFCITMVLAFMLVRSSPVKATTLYRGDNLTSEGNNAEQNNKQITGSDLIGRYSINYTGNINYFTGWLVGANNGEAGGPMKGRNTVYNDLGFPIYVNLSDYQNGKPQHYTKPNYWTAETDTFNSNDIKPNSSKATLTPLTDDAKIVDAYLIWYTRDSGNLFGYYNDPVCLYFPDGSNEWISPEYACIDTRYGIDSYLCMAANVTDYINDKSTGYGTYGVANIPYWYQTCLTTAGSTGGNAYGGWQLVVVEESNDTPIRAVKIDIGCTYAENGYTGALSLSDGLQSKPLEQSTAQIFFTGIFAGDTILDGNRTYTYNTLKSYNSSNSLLKTLTSERLTSGIFHNYTGNVASYDTIGLFATTRAFSDIGNNASKIHVTCTSGTKWDSYCCFGIAVDLAFPTFTGRQKTTINSDNSIVTVTGGYENVTTDSDTGVAGGDFVVQLDNELTARSSELIMTYTNGTTKTITGTYDNSAKTVTFAGVDLLNRGDKFTYRITCSITSTDDEIFYNSDKLSGYLYSNGARITGFPVEKVSSSSSRLSLIIKITLDLQGSAIDGRSATTAGTTSFYEYYQKGFYSDYAHTVEIRRITTPTKLGCQFMGYYTGKNGTGRQCIDANGSIIIANNTFTEDTILYAYWTPGVYAVIDGDTNQTLFYEKYCTGFYTTKILHANRVTYDATGQIAAISTVPAKNGYTFNGYFTAQNGGGSQYVLDNRNICMGTNWIMADTFVYAKWEPKTYTIYCDMQGGSDGSGYLTELYANYYCADVTTSYDSNTIPFLYTGGVQAFTAPYTGTYTLNVWGAQGGAALQNYATAATGGYGGYAAGTVNLVQGETLYIYVGGQGGNTNMLLQGNNWDITVTGSGGYNGGATGAGFINWWAHGAGGGATDIRRGGAGLENRIIVGGGGGGGAFATLRILQDYGGSVADSSPVAVTGGPGGDTTQNNINVIRFYGEKQYNVIAGCDNWYTVAYIRHGSECTDIEWNTPLLGSGNGQGNGGGYYGANLNSGTNVYIAAGTGGSNYTGGVSNGSTANGSWSGNGYATISYTHRIRNYQRTTKIDIPTRSGYTFLGYYTDKGIKVVDASGNITQSASFFDDSNTVNQTTTIYARWIYGENNYPSSPDNTYLVRFHGNGAGSGSMADRICVLGQTYAEALGYTRTGYSFVGWSKSPTGAGEYTKANGYVTSDNVLYYNHMTLGANANSVIDLYAVWKDIIPPTITVTNPVDGSVIMVNEGERMIEYPWINTSVNLVFSSADNVALNSLTLYHSDENWNIGSIISTKNNISSTSTALPSYTVTAEGITYYIVKAIDTAGNTTTIKIKVKIDYVAPVGITNVSYDGYNLNASISNITEKLSGCKRAWIVTNAHNADGSIIRTDSRDLTIVDAGKIHNGAAYKSTFALEDEYNYDAAYMTVTFWIRDIAGNERQLGDTQTIDTFYLTGYVTRALGPAEYWKAGEAGYVNVVTGVYVDKLYIQYPDTWTALDSGLGTHVFDYTGNKEFEKTEQDLFYIPVRADNGEYELTVIAERNGRTKTVVLPVKTDGNIVEQLRTRIRYSPDKYPIFKDNN